jgi:hypothetical protein
MKYPDFWHVILGNGTLGAFLAYLVIAYFAAAASLIHEASHRDIASTNTPHKFSWSFLFAANVWRLVSNFLAIPLLIRLVYEYVGMTWMILFSIAFGLVIDRAFMILKNIGVLTSDTFAAKIADKIKQSDLIVTQKQ